MFVSRTSQKFMGLDHIDPLALARFLAASSPAVEIVGFPSSQHIESGRERERCNIAKKWRWRRSDRVSCERPCAAALEPLLLPSATSPPLLVTTMPVNLPSLFPFFLFSFGGSDCVLFILGLVIFSYFSLHFAEFFMRFVSVGYETV